MAVIYHQPKYLPLDGIPLDSNKFIVEKSHAEFALGILQGSGREGLGRRFFNPSLLISPLATKEATVSSRIEGTQSTVSDVYKYEAGVSPEYSGTTEVANYRTAIIEAASSLGRGTQIDKTFIKGIHRILLTGVRHGGTLGDFRRRDVWIAEKENDPIEKALYIPPKFMSVESFMENLLEYLDKGKEDPLTKVAIVHYQFEAIHPFEDGNGRIGRLLVPLILLEKKALSVPILYMSGYFDAHREEYLASLHKVDETSRYEDWLRFFFNSAAEQLWETQALIDKINKLYDDTKEMVLGSRSPYVLPFLGYLFERPFFFATAAIEALGSTYPPVANLIRLFEKNGVIVQIPTPMDRRMKLYGFGKLIDLLS